jgi:hypothetical protein
MVSDIQRPRMHEFPGNSSGKLQQHKNKSILIISRYKAFEPDGSPVPKFQEFK